MGTYAQLRTDDALASAMRAAGHTPTTLARQVSAYGRPVTRQMITKLANPQASWSKTRRCRPDLAINIAQALRMPVEFLFTIVEPEPRKVSAARGMLPTMRNKGTQTTPAGGRLG